MDQVYVSSLMVVSKEMESDVYVASLMVISHLMFMCLVLEWSTGFFAMQMEDMLSTKMGTLPKLNP